jgi:hypothetical protein
MKRQNPLPLSLVQSAEDRVAKLRTDFANADPEIRARLLQNVHTKERFQHYDPAPHSFRRRRPAGEFK